MAMARLALADGITHCVCTPHIYPGLYHNDTRNITSAVTALRQELAAADLPLALSSGADIHLTPECLAALATGQYPTLAGSRYFLLEPPHHTVPVHFLALIQDALRAGYVPLITHPERLDWLDDRHYPWFVDAARAGAWLQVTAGALTGLFGARARRWSERLLGEGLTHVLASDAHDPRRRRPELAAARQRASQLLGEAEATRLVVDRPRAVLDNQPPHALPAPPGLRPAPRRPAPRLPDWRAYLPRWTGGQPARPAARHD